MAVSKDTSNETESEFPTQPDSLPALNDPTVLPSNWGSLLFSGTAEATRLVGANPTSLPAHGSWPTDLNTAAAGLAKMLTMRFSLSHTFEEIEGYGDERYSLYKSSSAFTYYSPATVAILELPAGMFTLTDSTGANPNAPFMVFRTLQDENDYGGDFTGGENHHGLGSPTNALGNVRLVFDGAGGLLSGITVDYSYVRLWGEKSTHSSYDDFYPARVLGEKLFVYITLMELPFE